jgi:hypothetical protein
MQDQSIKYGFNIFIRELMDTIPTLFSTVMEFVKLNKIKPGKLIASMTVSGCGGGIVGSGICSDGSCCSQSGYCGKTRNVCTTN